MENKNKGTVNIVGTRQLQSYVIVNNSDEYVYTSLGWISIYLNIQLGCLNYPRFYFNILNINLSKDVY